MIPLIATINLCIACTRLYFTVRQRRLIALAWFLISYFSFFYLPLSMTGNFRHIQKYTDGSVIVTSEDISNLIIFVFFFNLIFFASEVIITAVFKRNYLASWSISRSSTRINQLLLFMIGMLIVSGSLYGLSTWNFSYRDYVEYEGSSWSIVFFWAASPAIALAALQKRYFLAAILTIPYLYFALVMSIRSFALLSLIPLIVIYGQQTLLSGRRQAINKLKNLSLAATLFFVLLIFSSIVIQQKNGRGSGLILPDSGMAFGSAVAFKLIDTHGVQTEWDSLTLYVKNFLNPFIKLVGIKSDPITDTPVIIARLIEGQPKNWPVYTHYPMLWYSDAYISFGHNGLWLAVFWAAILVGFEILFARNPVLLGIFLPFYCWHVYMLVRGATAGAAVPFSYAAYIAMFLAFSFMKLKLLKTSALTKSSSEKLL